MKTKRRTFSEPDASPEYIAWLEERKRTICPLIQEENSRRKLDSQEQHTEPRSMRVCFYSRPRTVCLDGDL